jgi:hypothetical protein
VSFESGFLDLMPHTVSLASWTGFSTDGHGVPTYGTASTYRARVASPGAQELLRFSTGQTMVDRKVAWVATTRAVTLRDQVAFEGSTLRIVMFDRPADQDGVHHLKLYLGR